jgi:hypothetical protein
MAAPDKETLAADVAALRDQLAPQLAADRAKVEAQGRPFDEQGWLMGVPDTHKYPAGPVYAVRTSNARGCTRCVRGSALRERGTRDTRGELTKGPPKHPHPTFRHPPSCHAQPVKKGTPSLWDAAKYMSVQDLAATAAASLVFYGMGVAHGA